MKLQGNFIFDGTMLFNIKQLITVGEERTHVVKNKVSDRSIARSDRRTGLNWGVGGGWGGVGF